jgi:hypothetical protein
VNKVIQTNHRNPVSADNPVDNILTAEKIARTRGMREVLDRVKTGRIKIADFV